LADDTEKPKGKTKHEDVLARARERFRYVSEYEADNRAAQKEDTEFVYIPGAQWPTKARTMREQWGDPCMEFPQLKQFVSQVVNDQRQNRPGIRIYPADGIASEDTAEILQGLVRGIEYQSRAESVYDCGYQHAVVGGRGYWRVVSEYENESSFNQRLVIKRIADPLSVFLDPDFQDPDGGDRQYGFVVEQVSKEQYKKRWPDAPVVSLSAENVEWIVDDDHILVADYYERVSVPRKLVMLSDGTQAYEDELPQMPPGVTVTGERKVDVHRVDWYTIGGGMDVLAEHAWPGKIVPVVCAMGDEVIADNKRVYQGLIRHAKDTQTLFNFGMTQQAVSLALTPRAPYVAALGQVAANPQIKDMWDNANTRNYSVLYYEPTEINGNVVPPPQRQPGSSPDSGWLNWTQQMSMLMKSTIGMYENNLGMRGQETSGRAILAKEQQGDNATFHYLDNLGRAIALTGRILVECVPTYYDTERIVHLIGPDDTPKLATINREQPNPMNPMEAIRIGDVTTGQYAVVVEAGPTYATKRKEKADLLMGMVQAYPPLMQIAPDLIVKAQDLPDGDIIAKRLKLTLPPPIAQAVAAEDQGQTPPDPATMAQMQQMQGQMQQMDAQMQQMAAENQQLKAGAAEKQAAAQIDAQVKAQANELDAQVRAQATQTDAAVTLQQAEIKARADADAKIQSKLIEVAGDIVANALAAKVTPPAPVAGEAGEVAEAAPAAVPDLTMVMVALQETASALAAAAMAPKELRITEFAPDGTPLAGVSAPVLQ
jgi:hypothetical protein